MDYNNIISFSEFWFPKQIIISKDLDFKSVKNKLVDFCKNQRKIDSVGVKKSNVLGWQSDLFYPEEKYIWVYEYIMKLIRPAIFTQLNLKDRTNFSILNFWINISEKYSSNDYHIHSDSDYSGCLYIQYENKSGTIQLNPSLSTNTDWMRYLKDSFKDENKIHPSAEFSPEEGMVLLFPSDIPHKVNVNTLEKERITIAFNLKFFRDC